MNRRYKRTSDQKNMGAFKTGALVMIVLFCSCKVHRGIEFIDLELEMSKVESKEISVLELDLGCCGYEWVTYLDTGYYDVISTYEGFNHEINPRSDLKILADLPYDSIHTTKTSRSIVEAIEYGAELAEYIILHQNEVGIKKKHKIEQILIYKNKKALFSVNNSFYVLELLSPSLLGIVCVAKVFT